MVGRLEYTNNCIAYWFNLDSFSSEINPGGQPNGLSLSESVCEYFDFSTETKYNGNCYYSKKFQAYILPLENHLGEKNFIMIKNGKVFNPNNFVGFSLGKGFLKTPYFINDLTYAEGNENWIYFSKPNKALVDFVIEKYHTNPQYEDNFDGQILHLISSIPASWIYDNNHTTLLVAEPTLEDRTVLINLLPEDDFIELEAEIVIFLNSKSIQLLAKHCLTLYSTFQ